MQDMSSISQDKEAIKLWVNTWKRAGLALEALKQHELELFDYTKQETVIDAMLQFACEHRIPRLTSGLVEQQQWFMKMHKT